MPLIPAATPWREPQPIGTVRRAGRVMAHWDILEFDCESRWETTMMLRRQFPRKLRGYLLFEVREWARKPWVAVFICKGPVDRRSWRWFYANEDTKIFSCELINQPRRYKNQIIERATIDPALQAWVLLNM